MIRIATDVGGTFTELVAYDDTTGEFFQGKALTTVVDQSNGVLDTLLMATTQGLDPSAIGFLAHGGTTVINAITERKGVKTALVTTSGFRDVLEIGRGNRPDLYNLRFQSPLPFVPRHLRFEIRERMDHLGQVVDPIILDDLNHIIAVCVRENVEAIGVMFLHSYANPEHERLCVQALSAALPNVTVCASYQVSREWREYERSNTVVLNAYVQPVIRKYFLRLETALRAMGIVCPFYAMQSNGGIATFTQATDKPLTLVESGPAGGVAGAVRIGAALDTMDVLYLDVGGTTAKCSLIRDGRPRLDTHYKLEHTRLNPGYPVQVPVVDIVEIGAGGGSIARVDSLGALRVGPQSAGSTPGPACYGRGGSNPTVTDALVTIGVFDPTEFAGGTMVLHTDLARESLARLGEQIGSSAEEAALAVLDLALSNMINALKLVTVQRGHDPRDAAFVVSGGMGPALAAWLGREVQSPCTIIPPHPGLFSAWGMLAARPRADFRATWFSPLSQAALDAISERFDTMMAEAVAHFGQKAGASVHFDFSVEARYRGQEHGVVCSISATDAPADFAARFNAAHETAYTFALFAATIEITGLHLVATLDVETITLVPIDPSGRSLDAAKKSSRAVYFRGHGWQTCSVYRRELLPPEQAVLGPAIIEEATATTLLLPDQFAELTLNGILVLREHGR